MTIRIHLIKSWERKYLKKTYETKTPEKVPNQSKSVEKFIGSPKKKNHKKKHIRKRSP